MKLVLDTSAYVGLRKRNGRVEQLVRDASELLFSTVVLGELHAGFRGGNRYERNVEELEMFLSHPRIRVLDVTAATATRYGRVYDALKRKGRAMSPNDMWIAAHTLESAATLVTMDADFDAIDGLDVRHPR